jgi:hypothetical protein
MPPTLLDVCDRDHNGSVQLTGRRLHRLRKKSGFVSGYRFSDTVSPSKSDAPLGARQRQFTFSAASLVAGSGLWSFTSGQRRQFSVASSNMGWQFFLYASSV